EQIVLKNSGVLKNDSWRIGSGTNAVVFQLPTLPEPFVGNNVHFEEKIAYLATAFRVATRHSVVRVHCGDAGFNAPLPTV
ncbi:hypothetical protein ALC56_10365, partial [Trachymyrmex septentrionalis]